MNIRTIILGTLIVVIAFVGATLLMNVLWPTGPAPLQQARPALVAVPPLQPLTGTSTVLAPAAIAMAAIRDALAQHVWPALASGQLRTHLHATFPLEQVAAAPARPVAAALPAEGPDPAQPHYEHQPRRDDR